MAGPFHVVLLGPAIGPDVVANLQDNTMGRAVADRMGPAVVHSAELAEIEFTARPEDC